MTTPRYGRGEQSEASGRVRSSLKDRIGGLAFCDSITCSNAVKHQDKYRAGKKSTFIQQKTVEKYTLAWMVF